ncbi:SRPBCC domain-containing protein [Microbacterium sp. NPDC019599]|uniref:SRPBCC domain-containing protein n=1 Tax=Microbacterium sp. NPDC019599 TaxID=3154690 RepID=UPI0033F57D9E
MPGYIARADIDIDASPVKVWETLTTHASDVNFGATVESDWRPGSAVVWRGDWEGKSFVDTGEVLEAVAPHRLVLTHESGASADALQHRLTYELSGRGAGTHVELWQDGNATQGAAGESERNWVQHLEAVKERAER